MLSTRSLSIYLARSFIPISRHWPFVASNLFEALTDKQPVLRPKRQNRLYSIGRPKRPVLKFYPSFDCLKKLQCVTNFKVYPKQNGYNFLYSH